MAPSTLTLKRSASVMSARPSSPELGEDTIFVKRHKITGKPMRNSAGKRSLPSGYVNSERALEEDDSDYKTDGVGEDDEGEGIVVKPRSRPAKRHISPPPRALSPSFDPDPTEESSLGPAVQPAQDLSLTFNVPSGHVGPFIVKLDLASILGTPKLRASPAISTYSSLSSLSRAVTVSSSSTTPNSTSQTSPQSIRSGKRGQVGFLDLPPELRNIIYRHAFVTKTSIDFFSHMNFSHSGAFLATCRQVHEEGGEILYGENEFKFVRDNQRRGHYYETWSEIGWKDVRRFLSYAGPMNISLLRKVAITFEDAPLRSGDCPSFVNDDHLMECLKLLARHGALQKLTLAFHGRCQVKRHDTRFLENLKDVKADEVTIVADPHGRHRHSYGSWGQRRVANVEYNMEKQIIAGMERKEKLYGTH